MPTRKQRRRREKEQRHEYEYVVLDEEGKEVAVDPGELRKEKEHESGRDGRPAARGRTAAKARDGKGRPVRPMPPPSWSRAVKRALPWAAALAAIVIWTGSRSKSGSGFASAVVLGVLYAVAFVPMMYWIDRMAYRRYLRATGGSEKPKQPRR
jgi:hypothetical protein